MLVKGITSPSKSLDVASAVIDIEFIQNNQVMNIASLHDNRKFLVTSLRTFQTVYEVNLQFTPTHLALDPRKNLMLITGRNWESKEDDVDKHMVLNINDEQDDSELEADNDIDFFKIRLRIKDKWQFNMNDALIESFIYLPYKEAYRAREKELLKHMKEEVDIVNNINIISIFSMG